MHHHYTYLLLSCQYVYVYHVYGGFYLATLPEAPSFQGSQLELSSKLNKKSEKLIKRKTKQKLEYSKQELSLPLGMSQGTPWGPL